MVIWRVINKIIDIGMSIYFYGNSSFCTCGIAKYWLYLWEKGGDMMGYKVRAIIVAAGQGQRMDADMPKQFLNLKDKPILVHTLEKFDEVEDIDKIVVVTMGEYMDHVKNDILSMYHFKKPIMVIRGGSERQESVYRGIMSLGLDTDIVVIHDGVRPFVTGDMIQRTIDAAIEDEAAVVGVPIKDTIKEVDDDGYVIDTLYRDIMWNVQTPQTFKYDVIRGAHEFAEKHGIYGTDDAMLVERLDIPVKMVMGSYKNIKITTKEDMVVAEAFLKGDML